ncbi:sugar (pentulose or hexulose) kinase [Aequitasia blattaphilus]
MDGVKQIIEMGKVSLGIEFGSTRIKAVLIDQKATPLASGSYEWENQLVDGLWTYSLEEIHKGLQESYRDMKENVRSTYGVTIKKLASIGFSAMMHGYMAFDKEDRLLVPFRTWRNTNTIEAADKLTALFQYNVPIRWSVAHLYQSILNEEEHVKDVNYVSTLSGYIHWLLSGEKVLGIGDASGMFPIDTEKKDYHQSMVESFDALVADKNYNWKLRDIFPKVLCAGDDAGCLTEKGALLMDPEGDLEGNIPLCAPEGDAGTGMVATNSVAQRTGNVSAGTSVFAMIVLEKELSKVYPEIDMVTTPSGSLVAMAHANNCTSDLNAWVGIFKEFLESYGMKVDMNELFSLLYNKALEGDGDAGKLLSYGYFSGENIVPVTEGSPLFVRMPDSKFNLANFMRSHLFGALGALKIGMEILSEEGVKIDKIYGHGGLFKTPVVGQQMMAAAMNAPVSVMDTAGEGGAWGIAILASYLVNKDPKETLDEYLEGKVFQGETGSEIAPKAEDIEGFESYIERFKKGLAIEQSAIDHFRK